MSKDTARREAAQLLSINRQEIEAAMAQHFVGAPTPKPAEEDRCAAIALIDLLIRALGQSDECAIPPDQQAARRYHSLFGDGLLPVLRDVLGDEAEPELLACCVDDFWSSIRAREKAV